MPDAVSIVIPTWNGQHLLQRFLPSVLTAAAFHAARAHIPVDILIVDDGSTDGTRDWVQRLAPAIPARVVRHETNLGFSAAANRGIREATAPLVWLLNNDIEVEPDALAALASSFEDEDATLLSVHSRMVDLASDREVGTGKFGGFGRGFLRVHRSFVTKASAAGPFSSIFATGGSSLFRRSLFLEIGGFDPIFAPFYFEDVELSYRAWKRGYAVRYQPASTVRHQFSSTIAPLAGRRIERISQRNRLLFNWIHLHDPKFVAAHIYWLCVLTATAPLTLKFGWLGSLWDAVGKLPEIRARRRRERAAARRSDREVIQLFEKMAESADVRVYDNPRELDGEWSVAMRTVTQTRGDRGELEGD